MNSDSVCFVFVHSEHFLMLYEVLAYLLVRRYASSAYSIGSSWWVQEYIHVFTQMLIPCLSSWVVLGAHSLKGFAY